MLSIGSFSKVAKVTAKALRFYDKIGLLRPAYADSDTGYRYYDVAQLETVLLITKLKGYGFSLEEIAQVLVNPKDSTLILTIAAQKKAEMAEKIAYTTQVLQQLNEDMATLKEGVYIMSYLDEIEVKLVETQPMNILSLREKINVDAYGQYIGKLYETIGQQKLTPIGAPMTIFHDEAFDPASFDMEIAVPVKEVVKGTRDLPAYLCATATLKGPYDGLTSLYARIRAWMEKEGYTLAAPAFEIYLTDPATTAPEAYITEVCVPVKR